MKIELRPVGFVRGGRLQAQDDHWAGEQADIVLDAERFGPAALSGLSDFSHVEVIYHFHQADPAKVVNAARHPRGRTDWPQIGIFAQRGKNRPNLLGATVCDLVAVEGLTLTVCGLDAIDGTPVLDIKPYMSGFAPRGEVREPDWAREIMREYW